MKLIDPSTIIGCRFGRLIPIEKQRIKNRPLYECQCDCGNKTFVSVGQLRSGKTKSCGCFRHEFRRLNFGESSCHSLYRRYKDQAKNKNRIFLLSLNEFKSLTSSKCHYCGREPFQTNPTKRTYGQYQYNGIDRIDSNKGYIIDNCVPCCKFCNAMKSNLGEKEFLDHIKRIYEYQTKDILNG